MLEVFSALLPFVCLIFVTFTIRTYRPGASLCSSAITASLLWGIIIVSISEFLSIFHLLQRNYILYSWLAASSIPVFLLAHKKIHLPKTHFRFSRFYIPIFIIIVVTAITGVLYPPNNWDSMTYHLPKIEHWIQQNSLDIYPTSNPRQIVLAPFAELCILQLRLLSGSDILANSIQWLAFCGCILLAYSITVRLGGNTLQQQFAIVICATVPMAILQSSSTQTDLVVAYWLACLVDRLLLWIRTPSKWAALGIGTALGLACLTKGTAYPIALPFILTYAVYALKNYKLHLKYALIAASIALLLNLPHMYRSYSFSGDIMGRTALSSLNPEMSIKSLALISLCNFLSNEPPLPKVVRLELNKYLAELFKILDVSYPADTRFFFATTHPLDRPGWGLHEDIAQNPEHTALIFVSFFMLLCRKKTRLQSIFLINFFAAGTLFCILLTWQPWITRLQVPLFILGAPLTALALGKIQFARKPVSVVVIVLSLLPLFFNTSRQLAPFKAKTWTIWNKNRGELYFSNRRDLYEAYKQAINAIKINKSQKIGIMLDFDSWEYPLWLALRNEFPHATIEHISVNNSADSKNFDTIFVLDRVDARSMLPDSRIVNNPDVIFLPLRKIEQTHRPATSPINSE